MTSRISTRAGKDRYTFHSGHLALDLQETVIDRGGDDEWEKLGIPSDLDRWLHDAHLTPEDIQATEADRDDAVKLREALYRMVTARMRQEPYNDGDRDLVNGWAAEPMPVPQLDGNGLNWVGISVHACLVRIAWEGVLLLGGPAAGRIRKCAGDGCGLPFIDNSRSGRRRWCDMKSCGNRSKVNTFSQKKKAASASD